MKIIQSLLLKNIIISKTCKSSKLDLFPLQFTLTIKTQHCTFPGKPKRKPQYVLFPLVFFKKKKVVGILPHGSAVKKVPINGIAYFPFHWFEIELRVLSFSSSFCWPQVGQQNFAWQQSQASPLVGLEFLVKESCTSFQLRVSSGSDRKVSGAR